MTKMKLRRRQNKGPTTTTNLGAIGKEIKKEKTAAGNKPKENAEEGVVVPRLRRRSSKTAVKDGNVQSGVSKQKSADNYVDEVLSTRTRKRVDSKTTKQTKDDVNLAASDASEPSASSKILAKQRTNAASTKTNDAKKLVESTSFRIKKSKQKVDKTEPTGQINSQPKIPVMSRLDLSPCSVVISTEDDAAKLLGECHHIHSLTVQTDSGVRALKGQESHREKEELLSFVEKELGPIVSSDSEVGAFVPTPSAVTTPITNKRSHDSRVENKLAKVPICALQPSGKVRSVTSKRLQKKKDSESRTLNTWLKTAKSTSNSDGDACTSIVGSESPCADILVGEKLSSEASSNYKMKYINTHTPSEVRRVKKLESTPRVTSLSEAECEDDLFGFENLLKPTIGLLEDVSPIPRPKLPQALRKKKPDVFYKHNPEPWKGFLDLTNSFVESSKADKLGKGRKRRSSESNLVISSQEINIFQDSEDFFEKKDPLDKDVFEVEPDSPERTRRKKQPQKIFPHKKFNMEDALPWKEINEHELVIEHV